MDDEFAGIVQSIADQGSTGTAVSTPSISVGSKVANTTLRYSPELMVDLILNNQDFSPKQLGEIFGRPQSWVAQVLASQSFQTALDPHRAQVLNPEYAMTLEERFRGLTIRSLTVLQEKLEAGKALPDLTVVKIAELGIKALGMGQKVEKPTSPEDIPQNSSEKVAERIMAAMQKRKEAEASNTVDVEAKEVPNVVDSTGN
jgi:hypothetical protein